MSNSIEQKKVSSLSSPLLLLLLITALIRGTALFISLNSFNEDPDKYLQLAENWYSFGVYGNRETPTAFRPPLYPALLRSIVPLRISTERPKRYEKSERAGLSVDPNVSSETSCNNKFVQFFDKNLALSRNASIALLHWILGIVTVLLVWFYARRLDFSPTFAALAAFLTTIDPILLQQSRLVMTETLAAFFAALLLLATSIVVKKRTDPCSFLSYAILGLLFGLSTLCRPTFYIFFGLVLLLFATQELETFLVDKNFFAGLGRLLCFIIGTIVIILPWTIRNYSEFKRPILTTTHGGYTLFLANNPEIYSHYRNTPAFTYWDPSAFHTKTTQDYESARASDQIVRGSKEEELFKDEWYRLQADQTIRQDLQTFAYSCLMRAGELWRFLPNRVVLTTEKRHASRVAGIPADQLKEWGRQCVAVFYLIEYLLAFLACLLLLLNRRSRHDAGRSRSAVWRRLIYSALTPGFLLILSVQTPHLFYWTNMRMRAPLETFIPILSIMSVVLLSGLMSRSSKELETNQDPANIEK